MDDTASEGHTPNHLQRLAPLLVVVAAIVAGVNAMDATIAGVFYDDAHYLILAKALATGEGYRYINLPGAPAGTHFPPGYPWLLSLLWRSSPDFPGNIALFRLVNALFLGGVAYVVYCPARRLLRLGALPAALTALAATVTIPALLFSSNVMSETFFLLLLLPWLVLATNHAPRDDIRTPLLLGAGAGVLILVRSHAVVLVPALALVYLLERRWRPALLSVLAAIAVMLPWQLWVMANDARIPEIVRGQYGSYTGWFVEGLRTNPLGLIAGTLRQNVATISAVMARTFSVADNSLLNALAVLCASALLAFGALDWWRRWRVALLFLAFYMVVALVWPFSPLRFVWGIWPLFVLLMVSGAVYLWRAEWGAARVRRACVVLIGGVVVLGTIAFNIRGYRNSWWATASQSLAPRIQPQLQWVAANTDSSDVIVSSDEGAVYLYTGRRAVPASDFTAWQYLVDRTPAQEARDLDTIVRAFGARYVIAWSTPTLRAASALSAQTPPLIVRADTLPGGVVFRVR